MNVKLKPNNCLTDGLQFAGLHCRCRHVGRGLEGKLHNELSVMSINRFYIHMLLLVPLTSTSPWTIRVGQSIYGRIDLLAICAVCVCTHQPCVPQISRVWA